MGEDEPKPPYTKPVDASGYLKSALFAKKEKSDSSDGKE